MFPRIVQNGPGPLRASHGTLDLDRESLPEEMTIESRTEGREEINQRGDGTECHAEGTEWPQALCGEM